MYCQNEHINVTALAKRCQSNEKTSKMVKNEEGKLIQTHRASQHWGRPRWVIKTPIIGYRKSSTRVKQIRVLVLNSSKPRPPRSRLRRSRGVDARVGRVVGREPVSKPPDVVLVDELRAVFLVQGQDPRRRLLLLEREVGRDPPAAVVFVEAAPREPGPRPLVKVVDAAAVVDVLLSVVVSVPAEATRGRVVEGQRVQVKVMGSRDRRGDAVGRTGGDGTRCGCGIWWAGRERRGNWSDRRMEDRGRDDGDLLRRRSVDVVVNQLFASGLKQKPIY